MSPLPSSFSPRPSRRALTGCRFGWPPGSRYGRQVRLISPCHHINVGFCVADEVDARCSRLLSQSNYMAFHFLAVLHHQVGNCR